jgi:hypothetical protein
MHERNFLSKALFKGAQASPARPSDNSGIKVMVGVEHCWNDSDGGKRKILGGKTVPMRFCPPQIFLWPALVSNLGPVVTDRRLTVFCKEHEAQVNSVLKFKFVLQIVRAVLIVVRSILYSVQLTSGPYFNISN